jgi:S1-C subfamily serine protease
LGGQTVSLRRQVVRFFDLRTDHGVLVSHLEPRGAAVEAGVRKGDIVIELDQEPIVGVDDLHKRLGAERIGVPTRLTVIRGRQRLNLVVTPREARRG